MAASSWPLLLLCLAAVLQARGQTDNHGFISIDCGLQGSSGYREETTGLTFSADAGYTDAGENHDIAAGYIKPQDHRMYHDLRSFPDGARNCYTLQLAVGGLNKYLLRAGFFYGNYDGLNTPPVFALYIGVNLWKTVNISNNPSDAAVTAEAIVVVPDKQVQVCLVNTGLGTPFISALKVRPLKISLYPQVNATQGLLLYGRFNFGITNQTEIIRYPDDPYDRVWKPWVDTADWDVISTTKLVNNLNNDFFEPPSKVMQTAITPRGTSKEINFSWVAEPQNSREPMPGYIANQYFSELQELTGGAVREFNLSLNGYSLSQLKPEYLYSDDRYNTIPYCCYPRYKMSIYADAGSTLPPIINAIEIFSVISTSTVATDSLDASSVMAIKAKYQVQKDWMGDPCVPKDLAWAGLMCSDASPPRITRVYMNSSGLNGDISSYFANLTAVEYINLSHNNLTGPIPDALSSLSSLQMLDLAGNQLSGLIPSGLLKRVEDGTLELRYEDNPNICTNEKSCQTTPKRKGKIIAIYVVVSVVLAMIIAVSVAVPLFCLQRQRRRGVTNNYVKSQDERPTSRATTGGGVPDISLRLENRRFTYRELDTITNNFQQVIGRGGFGNVYNGFLEDGTHVAVKLRSESSHQGVNEFIAEAQILTRIHHKNLVSMIGYCKDGKYMALVYEYMSEGTLQEHIEGKHLTWRQRLQIGLDSAYGLEYLHKSSNPPFIHRDVKTTNILLNSKLEAKVADFGLSKPFSRATGTHVSTDTLAGTPGYVDPEYQATWQPTAKSDVYSFGVVLLEMITGKPAILADPKPTNIIQWARQRLSCGDIESIVDVRMGGDHDINSVWKAADVALKCTTQVSAQRPTMTEVAAQLQECLNLEEDRRAGGKTTQSSYSSVCNDVNSGYSAYATDQSPDVRQGSSAFEMEHGFGTMSMLATGPPAR